MDRNKFNDFVHKNFEMTDEMIVDRGKSCVNLDGGLVGADPNPPSLQKSIYFNLHRKITENIPFCTQVVYVKSKNIGKPYIYF